MSLLLEVKPKTLNKGLKRSTFSRLALGRKCHFLQVFKTISEKLNSGILHIFLYSKTIFLNLRDRN